MIINRFNESKKIRFNDIVIKEKHVDRIVANRFNILIPVGIAIIDVAKVR